MMKQIDYINFLYIYLFIYLASRVNNGTISPSNKTNFTPATKTNTNNLKIER